jgi:chitinase
VFCLFLSLAADMAGQSGNKKKIIAYYTGNGEVIKQYPLDKLTHIIYSFLAIHTDTLGFRNNKQEETLKQLVSLKEKFPHLKIMVSIGGWGGCAPCSEIFSSEKHRETFAKTTHVLFKKYNVDGIDLDWEYPAIEGYPGHKYMKEDRSNFTALIKTLRQELGPDYLLSFAAGGFDKFLEESVDWNAIVPYLDFINLMTYDLTSGFSKVTGHHTPLYNNDVQKQSTDNCVSWLLRNHIPSEKLIIGAAFYARIWEQVAEAGINKPGVFKQSIPYKNYAIHFSDTSGYKYYFDKKAKAPYRYNSRGRLFATFDDEKSIKLKCRYIRKQKLGGIMFWELSQDLPQNGLVDIIYSNIQ